MENNGVTCDTGYHSIRQKKYHYNNIFKFRRENEKWRKKKSFLKKGTHKNLREAQVAYNPYYPTNLK